MTDFDKKARARNEREIMEEMKREKARYQLNSYLDKKEKEKQKSKKIYIPHINKDDLEILNGTIYIRDNILSQPGITFYRLPLSIIEYKEVDQIDGILY